MWAGARRLVPALADARPITQYAGVRSVGSTPDYIIRPAAGGPQLLGYRLPGVVVHIGHHHPGALGGPQQRRLAPDPRAGPGDQGNFVL